ncbi:MAG: adenylyltransferase/cytidyltransferase family protein, partial [Candidatus Hydrogenedens sp.]
MVKSVVSSVDIGLFGGTFDPVHNVHIKLAYSALRHADLSTIIFVPAGIPPH